MAEARAARLRVRGEGQPLSHAYEEAEGPGGSRAAVFLARGSSRTHARPGAVSAAAPLAGQHRAIDDVSADAAEAAAGCGRGPRAELVHRRGVRTAEPVSRRAVPARHARIRVGPA